MVGSFLLLFIYSLKYTRTVTNCHLKNSTVFIEKSTELREEIELISHMDVCRFKLRILPSAEDDCINKKIIIGLFCRPKISRKNTIAMKHQAAKVSGLCLVWTHTPLSTGGKRKCGSNRIQVINTNHNTNSNLITALVLI